MKRKKIASLRRTLAEKKGVRTQGKRVWGIEATWMRSSRQGMQTFGIIRYKWRNKTMFALR